MKLTLLPTLAALILVPFLQADEGMWRPDQLAELGPELRAMGLEVEPEKLGDLTAYPMNAVIWLGGCTASFVSPQGLAVTNHHCAYEAIRYNSTKEKNLLRDGFLASKLSEELPAAPGSRIYVTVAFDDVTSKITGGLDANLSPRERYQIIDDRKKAMIAECEKDEGHRCSVDAFHGGLEYYRLKKLEIRDVRLVYAPPESIGKFGGDIDNWRWPRHTGDFSFYRAYVGPDGKPADHSEENVPYEPVAHLKVSKEGIGDGDFVMAAGYPGSTSRYRRKAVVENQFNWRYPVWITVLDEWIKTIERATADDEAARIKYASLLASLNNALTNFRGQVEGAEKVNLVKRRDNREAELNAWISASSERKAKYAEAIDELDALVEEVNSTRELDFYWSLVGRSSMLSTARTLYRLAKETEKPDAEREPGYQERDRKFIEQSMQALDRRYDPDVDRAVWKMFLALYRALPADQRVAEFDRFMGLTKGWDAAAVDKRLDGLYGGTKLGDADTRLAWMGKKSSEFEASEDPFIALAVALYRHDMEEEERDKTRSGRFQQLRPKYMEAIIAYERSGGKPVYPDANSTLRVTYGTVKGAEAADGLRYAPFTTLRGITAKYTGEDPFDSPQEQLDRIAAQDHGAFEVDELGSVPVNFLTTLDSTGGNSGSPTMNGKAELVGLLFDGTYESINSDWDFDVKTTRTIHVDSRYMLWVMDKVSGAHNLLEELGVK